MKNYVLGFAFDTARENVVLIKKLRPDYQSGKLNGVGGKVEFGESIFGAMAREFKEETGVETTVHDWDYFARFDCSGSEDDSGTDSQIFCFKLFDDIVARDVKTVEEEIIDVYNIRNLAVGYHDPIMENVLMLIYIAINRNDYSEVVEFVR